MRTDCNTCVRMGDTQSPSADKIGQPYYRTHRPGAVDEVDNSTEAQSLSSERIRQHSVRVGLLHITQGHRLEQLVDTSS